MELFALQLLFNDEMSPYYLITLKKKVLLKKKNRFDSISLPVLWKMFDLFCFPGEIHSCGVCRCFGGQWCILLVRAQMS